MFFCDLAGCAYFGISSPGTNVRKQSSFIIFVLVWIVTNKNRNTSSFFLIVKIGWDAIPCKSRVQQVISLTRCWHILRLLFFYVPLILFICKKYLACVQHWQMCAVKILRPSELPATKPKRHTSNNYHEPPGVFN